MTAPRPILGTARLGLDAGRFVPPGPMPEDEALLILATAIAGGIAALHTSPAFGFANQRIGTALKGLAQPPSILATLAGASLAAAENARALEAALDAQLQAMLEALGVVRLDALLLPDAASLDRHGGAALAHLERHRKAGRLGRIGVHAETPSDLLRVLKDGRIGTVLMPACVLDHRWRDLDLARRLARRPDLDLVGRGIFLAGAIAHGDARLIAHAPESLGHDALQALGRASLMLGRRGPADLALAFARGLGWLRGVVIAPSSLAQLQGLLDLLKAAPLEGAVAADLAASLPCLPEDALEASLRRLVP